jgi:hypothetical protein
MLSSSLVSPLVKRVLAQRQRRRRIHNFYQWEFFHHYSWRRVSGSSFYLFQHSFVSTLTWKNHQIIRWTTYLRNNDWGFNQFRGWSNARRRIVQNWGRHIMVFAWIQSRICFSCGGCSVTAQGFSIMPASSDDPTKTQMGCSNQDRGAHLCYS